MHFVNKECIVLVANNFHYPLPFLPLSISTYHKLVQGDEFWIKEDRRCKQAGGEQDHRQQHHWTHWLHLGIKVVSWMNQLFVVKNRDSSHQPELVKTIAYYLYPYFVFHVQYRFNLFILYLYSIYAEFV